MTVSAGLPPEAAAKNSAATFRANFVYMRYARTTATTIHMTFLAERFSFLRIAFFSSFLSSEASASAALS